MTASLLRNLPIENISVPSPIWSPITLRAANAVSRAVERSFVAGAVRAYESGDQERFAAYLARGRKWHDRFSRPSTSQMAAALKDLSLTQHAHTGANLMQVNGAPSNAILVYVHGGSFIAGRSQRLTALIARIAKSASMNTLLVDYRLAPEHPCPAAIDDAVACLRGLIHEGYDPSNIGLIAESAGAAIALSAALQLRDDGTRLGAITVLSPWTDLALTGSSVAARGVTGDSPIGMDSMAICAHLYLQGMSPLDPQASPVYANLQSLAPLLIHTSQSDVLHDDARTLAERAYAAGNDVTLRVWSRGSHVFERLFDQQSQRAIADVGTFLQRHLARGRAAIPR